MFKVTARTILELGSELISSDIIAFYELIKNAFDAKSRSGAEVRFAIVIRRNEYLRIRSEALSLAQSAASASKQTAVISRTLSDLKTDAIACLVASAQSEAIEAFKAAIERSSTFAMFIAQLDESYRSLNTIAIEDTGTGMSSTELVDNFLTIGTPSRKRAVDAAIAAGKADSPYLGEKGIGRLSAMRLGNRLRVETARSEEKSLNLLEIDWNRFAELDSMVEDIQVSPSVGGQKKSREWSGTNVVISDLVEDWTEKRLRDLAEYDFARLTDPFLDPKTRPRIALFWNSSRVAVPWMDRTLIEHAHGAFRGEYSVEQNSPRLRVEMEARNLGFDHPFETDVVVLDTPDLESAFCGPSSDIPPTALQAVGPFNFEAYWYNRRNLGAIDTIGNQKAVRELQRKWSGILLFRDGFRVFPYGDDEDDWLGLDRRALGRPGYVLNKNQFVGRVMIKRTANPGLVDQTNRQGLRETPEQQVLTAVLQHVVRDMLWDFFREIERRYKKAPVDLGDVKAQVAGLEARTNKAIARVRQLVPKDQREVVEDLQHAFSEFRDLSIRTQRRIDEVEAEGRQMVQMAGVGLMVEVVAHELARASESALTSLERLRGTQLPDAVRSKLETLRSEMKTVSKRLRVLDELSVSGRQRAEVFDLGELLDDLREGHAAQFERHNITFDIQMPDKRLRLRLVKGMLVQILENLISNSVYWTNLRASREANFKPRISITVNEDPLQVRFIDNGRGIAPDHRERVFRPFWSLKEKGKRRGLGLFIARENANYLGGRLILSDSIDGETGRLHEFILDLPQAAAAT